MAFARRVVPADYRSRPLGPWARRAVHQAQKQLRSLRIAERGTLKRREAGRSQVPAQPSSGRPHWRMLCVHPSLTPQNELPSAEFHEDRVQESEQDERNRPCVADPLAGPERTKRRGQRLDDQHQTASGLEYTAEFGKGAVNV